MSSIIDDLKNWLKKATPDDRVSLLSQLGKEKELYDLLKAAGFTPNIAEIEQKGRIADNIAESSIDITNRGVSINSMPTPLVGRVTSEEKNFIERWEWLPDTMNRRTFFFSRYTGRSYPYAPVFKSEVGKDPSTWNMPLPILDDLPTSETQGMRNAINMRNSIDGKTPDELYVAPRMAFEPPCMMRLTAKIPNNASIPSGGMLFFGFEVNSQGGNAIYCFYADNSGSDIRTRCMTPTGLDGQSTGVTLPHPNVYATYWLYYNPPSFSLFEMPFGGSITLLGTVTMVGADAYDCVIPFVAAERFNDASTAIINGFSVGHWAVWLKKSL